MNSQGSNGADGNGSSADGDGGDAADASEAKEIPIMHGEGTFTIGPESFTGEGDFVKLNFSGTTSRIYGVE
jgi:hypothetical protein